MGFFKFIDSTWEVSMLGIPFKITVLVTVPLQRCYHQWHFTVWFQTENGCLCGVWCNWLTTLYAGTIFSFNRKFMWLSHHHFRSWKVSTARLRFKWLSWYNCILSNYLHQPCFHTFPSLYVWSDCFVKSFLLLYVNLKKSVCVSITTVLM